MNFFETLVLSVPMGPKVTNNFEFLPGFKKIAEQSACSKKIKIHHNHDQNEKIHFLLESPSPLTQMGSLSVKILAQNSHAWAPLIKKWMTIWNGSLFLVHRDMRKI